MGTQHKNVSFVAVFTALACIAVYILTFTEFEPEIGERSSCSNTNGNLRRSPAISEDMRRFNNTVIRTIFRTPGFRWFDEQQISAQNNIYLEKYKLHYCKIDKNMGSTMQAILCFIDDQQLNSDLFFKQPWNAGLDGTPCGISTAAGNLRQRFLKAATYYDFFDEEYGISHFSIIRNPLSRFISAFVDICVNRVPIDRWTDIEYIQKYGCCFGCGPNLDCFVPQLHDFLYKQAEHLPVQRWSLDWHFFPQSWYCDYDRHMDKYHFIRYGRNEQFWEQIVQVFRNSSVEPHLVSVIEEKLKTKTAAHATFSKSDEYEKTMRENPILLEYVYKMYFLDFVWFGYRL